MLALMPAAEHAAVETFYARTVRAAGPPTCTLYFSYQHLLYFRSLSTLLTWHSHSSTSSWPFHPNPAW